MPRRAPAGALSARDSDSDGKGAIFLRASMARLYGRAPKGERCLAVIPHGHLKTTTFTAGLQIDGLTAPFVLDDPMNGDVFRAYVEHVLVAGLNPGDVDNLPAHKGDDQIEAGPALIFFYFGLGLARHATTAASARCTSRRSTRRSSSSI